jgi:pectate lyase
MSVRPPCFPGSIRKLIAAGVVIALPGCHTVSLDGDEAVASSRPLPAKLLAFPGAEGHGRHTAGGRGGAVIEVTNLDDSGTGSLRAAIEAAGPRTIVFRVSGTITLQKDLRIRNPYLTIAGQTAPGDGIALRRYPLVIEADEVIIRHLRVRLGDESGQDADAVSARFVRNLILDHVSASWSIDETLSIYHCEDVTVQWSFITESLYNSNHVKGKHGFGGIWGSERSSYHHNLLAHHSNRNPRFASGSGHTDFRNNVIYNWGYQATYGGEARQVGDTRFSSSDINVVSNYYQPGPATAPGEGTTKIVNPWSRAGAEDFGRWYVQGNVLEGDAKVSADNWAGGVRAQGGDEFLEGLRLTKPWAAMAIDEQRPAQARRLVLAQAGATRPRRDAVDERIAAEVLGGFANYEGPTYEKEHPVADRVRPVGIIDRPADVGGWPELLSLPAPSDHDHDGMPDEWERRQGLNPGDATDRNRAAPDGYTMLERYLADIG